VDSERSDNPPFGCGTQRNKIIVSAQGGLAEGVTRAIQSCLSAIQKGKIIFIFAVVNPRGLQPALQG
jgi:hypothetical protein